jgi:hypothetical protein
MYDIGVHCHCVSCLRCMSRIHSVSMRALIAAICAQAKSPLRRSNSGSP